MTTPEVTKTDPGEPTWRIALFYPQQGGWTEADYLSLQGGPLVEYDNGCVEVLDMPTKEHQRIVQFLFVAFQQFVLSHRLGEVFIAPLPVRLWPRKFREPDVIFLGSGREETDGYPDGADLVVEVVSPGAENRRRDLEIKPVEYAKAGIREFWLVDPESRMVTIHRSRDDRYESIRYDEHATAKSTVLPGFELPVAPVLAAAAGPSNPVVPRF